MKIISEFNRFQRISLPEVISMEEVYELADLLQEKLDAQYINQVNDFDQVYLHFFLDGVGIILSNSDFSGTEIYCEKGMEANDVENQKLSNIAEKLRGITFPPRDA